MSTMSEKRLQFGTGGLRGIMGDGLDKMNEDTVKLATAGLSSYLLDAYGEDARSRGVVIAYDSRLHSANFATAAARCLNHFGIKAFVFDKLTPTPILSFAVRYLGCIAGIVITASHNPKEYNGYKVYNSQGGQITPPTAEKISACIDKAVIPDINADSGDSSKLFCHVGDEIVDAFCKEAAKCGLFDCSAADRNALLAVYSPLHGTGNLPVRKVLAEAGFCVEVVSEQELPDASFSTVPTPNPEDRRALAMAVEKARCINADIAFGTDPDCDRIGVAVKHNGDYVMLTGNQLGALFADYIISKKQANNELAKDAVVIKTIVTSELGAQIARCHGAEVMDTLTGFKYIGEKIGEFSQSGKHTFLFGYEESYGYLIGTYARDKDAVGAALLLCEMTADYKRRGFTLVDRLEELYRQYGFYYDALDSITLDGQSGSISVDGIMGRLRRDAGLIFADLKDVKDYAAGIDGLPAGDVLKFIFTDGSWLAVRPSGTEPKIKFYYSVRADGRESAEKRYNAIKQKVEEVALQ